MIVKPMRFHGPAWEGYARGITYQVWAPRPAEPSMHDGRDYGPKERLGWQSAWTGDQGASGDVRKSPSLEEALSLFPASVAREFRREIKAWLADPSTTTWKLGALQ